MAQADRANCAFRLLAAISAHPEGEINVESTIVATPSATLIEGSPQPPTRASSPQVLKSPPDNGQDPARRL